MYKTINRTVRSTALAGIAFGALAATPAFAATTTDDLDITATVTANCSVSTTPVDFGDVNVVSASPDLATGGFSVTCTSGQAWTATADEGASAGASLAIRKMTDGTNFLDYVLYTDSGRTTVWGDGAGGTSNYGATGTGSAQANTIYARVPAGQSGVPAGSYTDTVIVTVTYI